MNIDITALLSGGAPTRAGKGKLIGEDFALTLDDRLAQMGLLLPGLDVPAQLLSHEGYPLPQPVLPPVAEPGESDDTLAEVRISTSPGDESPQWQLQQIVTRQARGPTEASTLADATLPREEVAGEKAPLTIPVDDIKLKPARREDTPLQMQAQALGGKAPDASAVMPGLTAHQGDASQHATCDPTVQSVVMEPSTARLVSQPVSQQVVNVRYPLESPEWKQSVSQHIALFSRDNLHNAEIRLHPQELGSLHISLRVQQDQAQIHIVSEHAQVRQMMETALPHLRAALAETGLQLGQASVSPDRPHTGGGEQGRHPSGEQHTAQGADNVFVDEDTVAELLTSTQGNIYGINTFA
ncbi:flagellar hook-length control protein FliK [Enterobacter hormaechei]|uniref:flagellar hook-length control protein FliK n=1 Tax=Enterobacter hormaechei TaxID=158836 RepID=UPI001252C9B0|nr:flagellar hook-length control protein FliK [Enterobacter hormaechei]VAF35642.1 flagellar hook-length control protein [Enterobacter hormaechei]HCD3953868.1 flagellar hook-length control protein FliK [Enterobacter hormaechei]